LRLLLVLASAVFLALAASAWFATREASRAAHWVKHTYEVLDELARARSDGVLAELHAQNYRLTGQATHLAARDAAFEAREASLRRLAGLIADNPRQRALWAQLRAVTDERMAIARRAGQLRKDEGPAAANAYVASAPVNESRERLFGILRAMEDEERRLLRQREAEEAQVRRVTTALTVMFALALAALLAVIFFLIRRQTRMDEAARLALEAMNVRLRAVLDTAVDGVIIINGRGIVESFNPAAERLFGYRAAEVIGQNVKLLMPEPYHGEHDGYLERYRAGGEARVIGVGREVTGRRKDGSTFPMDLSVSEMRINGDRLYAGIVRDISERKEAERMVREVNERLEQRVRERTAQLREREAQLQTVFENLAEGVVVAGLDGRILQFNRAAIGMFGFSRSEEYLRRLPEFTATLELSTLDGAILPLDQWPLARVLRGETLHDLEIVTRHLRDGWRKIFSYSGSLAHDASGLPLLAIVTIRDITEKKRAEQEILELNASLERRVAERTRQLEAANRAKSDFLANMSHELRTPLNSIIGFSEMLKDGVLGELSEKQRGFVTDIYDAGTHLLALINDILDLSKVEAGMLQLDAAAVDLPALLQASTLVVREKAIARRIRLDTRLAPGLGTVLADERKVKQIVYNLLANAVKFTPEGGTVLLAARRVSRAEVGFDTAMPSRLLALPSGEAAELLEISVEDSGVGMSEADLAQLFEPFTQVDSSVTRRHDGTGLGLALVRRLAELHGGTVGVASRPGVGSVFRVWLPYREAAVAPSPALSLPVADPTQTTRLSRPLALVIEDDDTLAEMVAAALASEGFSVMRAATGEEGLVRAAKCRPDLITLDIFLPHMDGWEVMRRIEAEPALAATPVVIITVSPDLAHGLALGARRVLLKPFTGEELSAALAGLVVTPPDGPAPCVLVVDDNQQAVERVATALQAEGLRVLRAYGGAEAITAARGQRPDLVILDLMMPDVSGFDVARALRESDATARIPILVLTAKDLTAEDHARLNGTVNAILTKAAFSRGELLAEVRRALARRQGS